MKHMTIVIAAAGVVAALLPAPGWASEQDVKNAYMLGEAAVGTGTAVEYDVSGWNSTVDVNISSMLPGDCRTVAASLCLFAKTKQTWDNPWKVRCFLTVGERPAAICSTK